jgi:hypothetical protein
VSTSSKRHGRACPGHPRKGSRKAALAFAAQRMLRYDFIIYNLEAPMPAIQSSTIAWAEYNDATEEMEIKFHNGGVYIYSGVEKKTYQDFLDADSKGKFFSRFIKDKYPTKRVR